MMTHVQFGLSIRVVTPRDLTAGLSGTRANSIIFDEHEDQMATKQKSKQTRPARPIAFPPQKRMPVTVRDPLSRRIVKRK
jgi:hypothetical protein